MIRRKRSNKCFENLSVTGASPGGGAQQGDPRVRNQIISNINPVVPLMCTENEIETS